jgi:hypothetical protein
MIFKLNKADINLNNLASSTLEPDRPPVFRSIKKILFFTIFEGLGKTLKKTLSKLKSENSYQSNTLKGVVDSKAAISFDNGESWYVHSTGHFVDNLSEWYHPFSVDSELSYIEKTIESNEEVGNLLIFGGGDYVRSYVLSNFKKSRHFLICDYNDTVLNAFITFKNRINNWRNALDAWGKLKHPIGIIATYHSNHVEQAYELVNSNASGYIFIEKPPLVDFFTDIQKFEELYGQNAKIEIGFNRRYARMTKLAKDYLDQVQGATILNLSVNEIKINQNHWYYWETEGTRITGNACHWIDLSIYLINSKPSQISLIKSSTSNEEVTLIINFEDGSISTISISEVGSTLRGVHELLTMKKGDTTIHIDDFVKLTIDSNNGRKTFRSLKRDKGHDSMYKSFSDRVTNDIKGKQRFQTNYPLSDLKKVSFITYMFSKMVKDDTLSSTFMIDDI